MSSDAATTSHDRQCQTPPKDQVAQVLPDFQHTVFCVNLSVRTVAVEPGGELTKLRTVVI